MTPMPIRVQLPFLVWLVATHSDVGYVHHEPVSYVLADRHCVPCLRPGPPADSIHYRRGKKEAHLG